MSTYQNLPSASGSYAPTQNRAIVAERTFVNTVYLWMTAGLMVTAFTALLVASSPGLVNPVLENTFLRFGLLIAQLGAVIFLSARIEKMSVATARLTFLAYAVLTGFTLSILFVVYTQGSLFNAFAVSGGMFGVMSLYGYTTKADLSRLGSILGMGLIGLVIATVVNLFWANSTLYWITTYAGVLIFVGLTAYDTQKIKRMGESSATDGERGQKYAVLGALTLYLDFINLFLLMLRLLGNRK